ncbi:MAG: hypothetical protein NT007_06265 [Candidatus Kapabacteria bacterium]|nr:hypothetical protein [Candidatus Kapabacteria bacterium]
MQSLVVPISINSKGMVFIPNEYLIMLPKEKLLKATVEIPEYNNELENLKKMSTQEFFSGYSDKDDIYDEL